QRGHGEASGLAQRGHGDANGSGQLRLLNLARGAYVDVEVFAAADAKERHRLRVVALMRSAPGLFLASHVSAAVVWGLPVWITRLDRVHVAHTRSDKSRRHARHTVHRRYPAEVGTTHRGIPVVNATFAAVGT